MTGTELPKINKISVSDLRQVLALGWGDFINAPLYGLFFGGFYALGGILLVSGVFVYDMPWLAYPMVIGFALLGPFIATGLYEVSRRLEQGEATEWAGILGVVWQQKNRELGWMAFILLFVFWVWMYQVRTLVAVFFGASGFASLHGFLNAVFFTQQGIVFLIVGNLVGAVISLVLFSLTVISCPLLLDRETDVVTAMITSIRVVKASPLVMLGWGIAVVLLILLSTVAAFLGLLAVLPILGHATWHLYRRAV